MIRYMRKYRLITYVITGAVAILLILGFQFFGTDGKTAVPFPWSFLIPFLIFLLANVVVSYVMTRYVDNKTEKLVSAFNDDCDPKQLIEEGEKFASPVLQQTPYEDTGSWFVSNYTLALIDQGKRKEAEPYAKSLVTSAKAAQTPESIFDISVNAYEPIKEMLGPDTAQDVLTQINSLIENNPKLQQDKAIGYVNWVQHVQEEEASSDKNALIDLYQSVISDNTAAMRKRVQAADKLSVIYRGLSNIEGEKTCYQFILEAGNTMGCVRRAKTRLAQL